MPKQICFSASEINFAEWKGDFLAVAVSEKDMSKDSDSKFENSILNKLDDQLGGMLTEASSEEDFTGKSGQSIILRLPSMGFRRLGLIGLGQCSTSPSVTSAYRNLGEAIALATKASQSSKAAVVLASSDGFSLESKLNTAYSVASGMDCKLFTYVFFYCNIIFLLPLCHRFRNYFGGLRRH